MTPTIERKQFTDLTIITQAQKFRSVQPDLAWERAILLAEWHLQAKKTNQRWVSTVKRYMAL